MLTSAFEHMSPVSLFTIHWETQPHENGLHSLISTGVWLQADCESQITHSSYIFAEGQLCDEAVGCQCIACFNCDHQQHTCMVMMNFVALKFQTCRMLQVHGKGE